jgi:polysaccharide biosynthesis transport protein
MTAESESQPDFLRYWLILKRRWIPAALVFSSTLGVTIAYVLLKTPIYQVQGQLIYEQDKTSSMLGFSSAAKDLGLGGGDGDRKIESELRVILSQPVLQRTLDSLRSSVSQNSLPTLIQFKNALTVKNAPNTNTVQISYDAEDSALAASLVNQLMQVYQQNNVQTTRSTSVAARQFITAQIPEVRQNVFRADVALRQFKERYRLTNLEVATKGNAENLTRIAGQIDQAQTQLTGLESDYQDLQQKLKLNAQEALAVSSVSQSLGVQASLADVQGLERKLEEARAQYQNDHPVVIDLAAKTENAQALLRKNVAESLQGQGVPATSRLQVGATQQELLNSLIKTGISRTGLGNQLSTLNQQRAAYLNQAKFLPALEQRLRELERELLAAEATYQALLKSLQEVRVSENQTIGNVRIIEPAQIPLVPIAPNKRAAITAGILAGVLLAIALVYWLETIDTRVKRVEEAQALFDCTLLGTIPLFPEVPDNTELSRLPVLRDPRSLISESYRMLQANLKFLKSDERIQVIAITSSIPAEGKSTTCANLAAVLNVMGHNVLVLDLDLRRPSQHTIWELSNAAGISDFLAGQVVNVSDVTRTIQAGLDVITSGQLPPNPLGLIDSQRMADILQTWSKHYDYVLIDTPPISVAADAVVLGKLTDGLMITARPNVLDKNAGRVAKDYLSQAGINVLGLVVNGVVPENEPHSYYSYSHYSHYTQALETKPENNGVVERPRIDV